MSNKKIAGIYCITNIQNNKKYVGYSMNIKRRWQQHKDALKRGVSHSIHLQNAWKKYGEEYFVFSIIEEMTNGLSKPEYEAVETKWVLHFNSHLEEFGYNGCLPGAHPIPERVKNRVRKIRVNNSVVYTLNIETKELIIHNSINDASNYTKVKTSKISDCCSYWTLTKSKYTKRSRSGFIFIREKDYDPEFDYINFRKPGNRVEKRKTWRDYPCNKRKSLEDIIPTEKRNLKRVPIIALDVITGEEKYYKMIKDCHKEFLKCKIYKCINSPFGKYQHRGHYFKRAEG